MTTEATVEVVEPKLFSGVVADEIIASTGDAISDRGRCTLVLSGGKTPSEIYRTMAVPPRVEEVQWTNLVLLWGDERFVPHTDVQSNYQTVRETLLTRLPEDTGPKVLPFDTALKSPEDSAKAYEKSIRELIETPPGEMPIFDLVMLGVGEDGHVASIFPGSSLIKDSQGKVCVATKAPTNISKRISLTPDAIFSARKILIIVRGESKADVVHRILRGNESESDLPAMMYRRGGSRVTWFLDSGAAKKL